MLNSFLINMVVNDLQCHLREKKSPVLPDEIFRIKKYNDIINNKQLNNDSLLGRASKEKGTAVRTMDIINWIIIIAKILKLIASGIPRPQAVASVASKYNISEAEIWKHGGF